MYSCSSPLLLRKDLLNVMYFKWPFLELASLPPSPLPLMTTLDRGFYTLPAARWQRRKHRTQGCQRNLKHVFITAEKDKVQEQLRPAYGLWTHLCSPPPSHRPSPISPSLLSPIDSNGPCRLHAALRWDFQHQGKNSAYETKLGHGFDHLC